MTATQLLTPADLKQCSHCGQRKPADAFIGRAKDCLTCQATKALRPRGTLTPVERAMTAATAWQKMEAERSRVSRETGVPHAIDHVVPLRSKIDRNSDDYVLICGLDVPTNWEVIPAKANGKKWMRFTNADRRAEEARLMAFASSAT